MRRNLRLDWRALALLGALLSIIIDWPGLVYAMPTILPPVAATTTEAAPIDLQNAFKNLADQQVSYKRLTTMMPPLLQQETDLKLKQPLQTQTLTTTTDENENAKQQQQVIKDNFNSIRKKPTEIYFKEPEQKQETAILYVEKGNSLTTPVLAAAAYETESPTEVSLLNQNTHIKNSINKNIENIIFKSNTTTPPPTPPSLTLPTTTESSAKIQTTLIPSTIVETDATNATTTTIQKQEQLETIFKFSSSHHLAILSRTERSIRSSSSSASSLLALTAYDSNSSSSSSSSSSSVSGAGLMVRRSSDMSVMKSKRLNNSRNLHHKNNLDRNERSTVSHLSGPSRKIQLYIKNRFLQLLPDGTVNGTQDEQCDYTILQRSTVEVGRIKIQGVATCLYLCMDACGAVYGSKEFTDDCVFNESMEQHNYNTYSSTYNSNTRRKYYLALNRHGEPRKLQIPPSRSLGKLATYTNAIPETVPQERVEQLIAKNFGANRVKHGIRQLCDTGKPLIELIDSKNFKARPKCNPNNSNSNTNSNNNNSNSKNNLSRNLDKDNSLVSHNHNHNHNQQQQQHQHQQQQHTTNNSNSNGQVLYNVPVANDKNNNNLDMNSRSSISSSSSTSETNRVTSSSPSSISISQNNGHISNSNHSNSSRHTTSSGSSSSSSNSSSSNNDTSTTTLFNSNNSSSISHSSTPQNSLHRGGGGKKAGKKRKCRRFENEEQHNCTTPLNRPTSFTKLGPLRQQKCQNLLMQQQQAGVIDIVLPPMCTKKGGSKNKGNKRNQGKNTLGTDALGPHNRRGKKLNRNGSAGNGNGRQAAKNNQNNGNAVSKKKQKNSKKGPGTGNANNNGGGNKKNKKSSSSTTASSSSTLKTKFWETTSLMPSTTLYENYDPHAENTSDRGDREQRNARYSNSMEEYMEQSSEEISANEDPEDTDDNDNNESNEDASYEDDTYISSSSSSSHTNYKANESSHTPLTAGAEDFLYYDQLDFIPMGLWEFIAVLWILAWNLHTIS